jgi:hypothetical protein
MTTDEIKKIALCDFERITKLLSSQYCPVCWIFGIMV